MYQYRIEHVSKVRSGDALTLVLDLGFQVSTTVSVRLSGVETPEFGSFDRFGKDEGATARDFTVEWFKGIAPFVLHTVRDRRGDYYGTVYNANGEDLSNALLEAKLGRTVT